MKYLSIIIIVLAFFGSALGQEDEASRIPEYQSKLMIGSALNTTYGSGLAFNYVYEKHGINLNFLPLSSVSRTGSSNTTLRYLNWGLSYNYYIRKNEIVDFSLRTGFQRIGGSLIDSNFIETETDARYNVGIGPEISFHLSKEIDFNVNLGYGLYNITESLNSSISAGFGLYYNVYLN